MMVQGEVVKTNRKAFIGVVYAYTIVMLGTTLPTPLYPIYSEAFDLSTLMITMIYAVYAAGVIRALLVFGHWSDRIGRKYNLIPGFVISASSALIFLFFCHMICFAFLLLFFGLFSDFVNCPLRIVLVVYLIMLIPCCIALIMMTGTVQERSKVHCKIQKLSVR